MKTFLINKEIRNYCHFYSQPESGRLITFEFSGPAIKVLKGICQLKEFEIISVQSSSTKFNAYRKCQLLKIHETSVNNISVLFKCEKIQSGITLSDIRREKLIQIGDGCN